MINSSLIFRFKLRNIYENEINKIYQMFSNRMPNDEEFIEWYKKEERSICDRFPEEVSCTEIEDPFKNKRILRSEN